MRYFNEDCYDENSKYVCGFNYDALDNYCWKEFYFDDLDDYDDDLDD